MKHNPLIAGTLLLTAAGFLCRILGFFYRIFLSRAIGAEGLGIYQMIFPIHGIAFALCAGPIQTSISRLTAADEKKGRELFHAGLFISLCIALVLAVSIRFSAAFLAENILLEPRCAPLLPVMALSIPFSAVHACICGYYYGRKKTVVPAASQLIEQCIRISAVFLIARVCSVNGIPISVSLAVWGMLIGEAGSAVFSFLAYSFSPTFSSGNRKTVPEKEEITSLPGYKIQDNNARTWLPLAAPLMAMALPLMGNRLILSILQSLEAIFVPNKLIQYGMSSTEALSIYGVLTGMALPFILFPSAITNSLAVVLLPTVSEAQAAGNRRKIERTISMALRYSLYMGILCIGLFTLLGNDLGLTVYHNPDAGFFIAALSWLCPFMYLSTTMGSILNGLGKTSSVFFHHAVSMLITLFIVVFFIPRFGIHAYLFALLISELVLSFLHIHTLSGEIHIRLQAGRGIVKPVLCLAVSIGILRALLTSVGPALENLPADFLGVMAQAGILSVLYGGLLLLLHKKENKDVRRQ